MADKVSKGRLEAQYRRQNLRILGVDEVGRGCLAGPVYAACAAIDYQKLAKLDSRTKGLIRDSKTLSRRQRQSILPTLHSICSEQTIGIASVEEIETDGIVSATFRAMHRAFSDLQDSYDLLLIDGKHTNPLIDIPQETVIGGDGLCFAIAAASIIAKEARDSFMHAAAKTYPDYGFIDNVGYGTKTHLEALLVHGITPLHRRNFAPISEIARNSPAFS